MRGAGKVAWLLGRPDVEGRWGGYELRVDVLASRLPYTGLCCTSCACEPATTLISRAVHPLQLVPPGPDDRPLFGVHGTADGGLELVGEIDCWSAEDVRVLLAAKASSVSDSTPAPRRSRNPMACSVASRSRARFPMPAGPRITSTPLRGPRHQAAHFDHSGPGG